MQTANIASAVIRGFSGTPAPNAKDSTGMTLTKVREQALGKTWPTGKVLVIGRLYKNPTLSQTWTWDTRFQAPGLANRDERGPGGLFRAVEVMAPQAVAAPTKRTFPLPW